MIKVKRTVRPYALHIVCAIVNAALELDLLAKDDATLDLLITSAQDSTHGAGSMHPLGRAVDLRTKNLTPAEKHGLRDRVRERLGDAYDVILEDEGGPNEHLHVERDPVRGGQDS